MLSVGPMILAVICTDAAGNLLLRRGMKGGWVVNPVLGGGILCMAVSFFLFAALLSRANLSFVLPITAMGYVINVVGARHLLKENVTPARWAGTLLIGVGVALVCL